MKPQCRTDNDNRTTGVIDTFPQKVLTETSLFSPQHIGKRFFRTAIGRRCFFLRIIEKRINSFLQHPFFVADDDIRSVKIQQLLEPSVTGNDFSIEIIEVGSREPTAFQLNHRPQIRRNHRNHIQNHPFGFIARIAEIFNDFDTLDQPFFSFRALLNHLSAQLHR